LSTGAIVGRAVVMGSLTPTGGATLAWRTSLVSGQAIVA
jgi:hypothetical protein